MNRFRNLGRLCCAIGVLLYLTACTTSGKPKARICVGDDQCGGDLCLAGQCVALTSCNSTADCAGAGTCQQGKCWETSCDESNPCPFGECTDGYCVRTATSPDLGGEDTAEDRQTVGEDAGCTSNTQCEGVFNDLKECEQAVCSSGVCKRVPRPAGDSCNDGNGCTQSDKCDGTGTCVGSDPVSCVDANNPCSTGALCVSTGDSTHSCDYAPGKGNSCEDGNPCTLGDLCDDKGVCLGGSSNPCDTGKECELGGTCSVVNGSPTCDYNATQNKVCDDLNACTITNRCLDGTCIGDPLPLGTECGSDDNPRMMCGLSGDCVSWVGQQFNPDLTQYPNPAKQPQQLKFRQLCKTSDGKLFGLSLAYHKRDVDGVDELTQYTGLHQLTDGAVVKTEVPLTLSVLLDDINTSRYSLCSNGVVLSHVVDSGVARYDTLTETWGSDSVTGWIKTEFDKVGSPNSLWTGDTMFFTAVPTPTIWVGGGLSWSGGGADNSIDRSNYLIRCCKMDNGDICDPAGIARCVYDKMTPSSTDLYSVDDYWRTRRIVGDGIEVWALKGLNKGSNSPNGAWKLDFNFFDSSDGFYFTSGTPGCHGFDPLTNGEPNPCYHTRGFQAESWIDRVGWRDLTSTMIEGSPQLVLTGESDFTGLSLPPTVENPLFFHGKVSHYDGISWSVLPGFPASKVYRKHKNGTGTIDLASVTFLFLRGRLLSDGRHIVVVGGMVYCTNETQTQDCRVDKTDITNNHARPFVAVYDLLQKRWNGMVPIADPVTWSCCDDQATSCTAHPTCSTDQRQARIANDLGFSMDLLESVDALEIYVLHNRYNLAYDPQNNPDVPEYFQDIHYYKTPKPLP